MSAITALTAQNTTGVYGIMDATPEFVANQLDCIFTDIRPDAVKIGMVSNSAIIEVIAEKLKEHGIPSEILVPIQKDWNEDLLFSQQEEIRCPTLQL